MLDTTRCEKTHLVAIAVLGAVWTRLYPVISLFDIGSRTALSRHPLLSDISTFLHSFTGLVDVALQTEDSLSVIDSFMDIINWETMAITGIQFGLLVLSQLSSYDFIGKIGWIFDRETISNKNYRLAFEPIIGIPLIFTKRNPLTIYMA